MDNIKRVGSINETSKKYGLSRNYIDKLCKTGVIPTKKKYAKYEIWDADMIKTALDNCKDTKLYIALNLAFACSFRMGEILGMTWDNVHISDGDLSRDDAYVYLESNSK